MIDYPATAAKCAETVANWGLDRDLPPIGPATPTRILFHGQICFDIAEGRKTSRYAVLYDTPHYLRSVGCLVEVTR